MNNLLGAKYSSLFWNLLFTGFQIYGLLLLNWSGLYIVYLYWIELTFLSLYILIRYWQLLHLNLKSEFKTYSVIRIDYDNGKNEFIALLLIKLAYLAFYLFLIGVTAVPYEQNYYNREVESAAVFFRNLIVNDPLFILAAFFIVSYYLKMFFSKVKTSPKAIVEFSFGIDPLEARITTPGLAIITLPILLMLYAYIPFLNQEQKSNLYLFAVWLLLIRICIDVVLIYKLKAQMRIRGL